MIFSINKQPPSQIEINQERKKFETKKGFLNSKKKKLSINIIVTMVVLFMGALLLSKNEFLNLLYACSLFSIGVIVILFNYYLGEIQILRMFLFLLILTFTITGICYANPFLISPMATIITVSFFKLININEHIIEINKTSLSFKPINSTDAKSVIKLCQKHTDIEFYRQKLIKINRLPCEAELSMMRQYASERAAKRVDADNQQALSDIMDPKSIQLVGGRGII